MMDLSELTAIVGAAAGVIGLGLAGWALYYSKDSRDIAKDGRTDAEKALSLARDSNVIAAEAKQVAEEANTISLRGEQRDTERHDADWDLDHAEPGTYVLKNTGTDTAHSVRLRVTVDGWEAVQTYELVEGGDPVMISVPEAAHAFAVEQRELHRAQQDWRDEQQRQRQSPYPVPSLGIDLTTNHLRMKFQTHNVSYRVDWQTALGSHRDKSDDYQDSLGEHNF